MRGMTLDDWNGCFKLVRDRDPHGCLRSIHNCFAFYDHSLPWITHASVQSSELSEGR